MKKKIIVILVILFIIFIILYLIIGKNIVKEEKNVKCYTKSDTNGFVIKNDVLYSYLGDEEKITIPGGVRVIKKGAFEKNESCKYGKNLKTVIIPKTVTKIEHEAFAFTYVDRIIFLNGFNAKIYHDTFLDSYLKEIYFPSSIKSAEESMFNTEEANNITIHINKNSYMEKYFKKKKNLPYGEYIILTDYDSAIKQFVN